jgi:hypothetical protein
MDTNNVSVSQGDLSTARTKHHTVDKYQAQVAALMDLGTMDMDPQIRYL